MFGAAAQRGRFACNVSKTQGASLWVRDGGICPSPYSGARSRGIDPAAAWRNDEAMNPQNTPRDLQPLTVRAAQQLQDWEQLRDQLQALHAELEYLRLMLKLSAVK
jgi:hypothetical protein